MESNIMHLLRAIDKEGAKLSVQYDEFEDDLIFIFDLNGDAYKEILKHSETRLYENQDMLLSYVLEEILIVVRGLKEMKE